MAHEGAHSSSAPLPVDLLWQRGWPPAAQFSWSRIGEIESVPRGDLAADFWSGEKERSKAASRTLADLLFAAGRGEEALAALILAADPAEPQTFEIVLPQLTYAIEHLRTYILDKPRPRGCGPGRRQARPARRHGRSDRHIDRARLRSKAETAPCRPRRD